MYSRKMVKITVVPSFEDESSCGQASLDGYQSSVSFSSESGDISSARDSNGQSKPKRKRENLDHMSQDEKMQRRK